MSGIDTSSSKLPITTTYIMDCYVTFPLRKYTGFFSSAVRYILEVITDQCSAFDLIRKNEVLAAGMELDFFH